MVGRRIPCACQADGTILRVFVGPVAGMQRAVLRGPILVAHFPEQPLQVVVGRHVFGIDRERLFKLGNRLAVSRHGLLSAALPRGCSPQIEERLAEEVDHLVVDAEVEATTDDIGAAVGEHGPEVLLGGFEVPLLAIDHAGEPGPGPSGKTVRVTERRGPIERVHGLVEPPLGVEHADEIQRAIPAAESFHFLEGFGSLAEFARPLEQHADAVVVPPLPDGNVSGSVHNSSVAGRRGKHDPIHRQRRDRQLVDVASARFVAADGPAEPLGTAGDIVHVVPVELPVLQLYLHLDRAGDVVGHLQNVVHRLPCARWNLVVVERGEDVLGIAAVDAVTVAVEHE